MTKYIIKGYASLFHQCDIHNDEICKGAFLKTLKNRNPKMLFQHNPLNVLGEWDVVEEINNGLYVIGSVFSSIDEYIIKDIINEDITGLSIGFKTIKAKKEKDKRFLKEIDLWEISLVQFPALDTARFELMSIIKD